MVIAAAALRGLGQNEGEKCTVRCTSAAPMAGEKPGGSEGVLVFEGGVIAPPWRGVGSALPRLDTNPIALSPGGCLTYGVVCHFSSPAPGYVSARSGAVVAPPLVYVPFWGSLPPPVDATEQDPGAPCAGGRAVGALSEVHSRPDLPGPIA